MSLSAIDEWIQRSKRFRPGEREEIERDVLEATRHLVWVPNPGSQRQAFESEADETGFGGEAGPGKTDLLIGLSVTKHARSLILRRTNKEAVKLVDRYVEIIGHRKGLNEQRGTWRLGKRTIDYGGCEHEDDKQKRKGNPYDLIGFDEVVDFTESQYTFIIQWNRSTNPNQRCRVVSTFNPPTKPSGLWVIRRWGPWLDPHHPRPAKSGEIRWFTMVEGKDTEVDGPGPHIINGDRIMAKSRTFIRGYLHENTALHNTGYDATRAAAPEKLRQAYREGNFEASLLDAPNQVCPTTWVRAAVSRWTQRPPDGVPMCAMGVDASGGGQDPMIIACRHDGWYAPMVEVPGKAIPQDRAGTHCAGIVISYRRDNATVIIDMGGGFGMGTYEQLKRNEIDCVGYKGAARSTRRTRERQLAFKNVRSEAWWRFREALDPSNPSGSSIMLPDDPMLFADLTAPIFYEDQNVIEIEAKEDVVDRLGRSTDRGDAVIMAWYTGAKFHAEGVSLPPGGYPMRLTPGRRPQVVMGRQNARRR